VPGIAAHRRSIPNALNVINRTVVRATSVNGCAVGACGSLSPKQSPAPSSPTVSSPRQTAAVPVRITENTPMVVPSRTSSVPSGTIASITGPASERTSRARSAPNTGSVAGMAAGPGGSEPAWKPSAATP